MKNKLTTIILLAICLLLPAGCAIWITLHQEP